MEPVIKHVKVSRTARYLMLGNNSLQPQTVIIALHGYGMQVNSFARHFEPLVKPGVWVIVPEGLSRFYKSGFSGDVVASWMTREDRLTEIDDYVSYLDQIHTGLFAGLPVRTVLLGFSQGASTASRWWCMGKAPIDDMILWCGEFATDSDPCRELKPPIRNIFALRDEFITPERSRMQSERLRMNGFTVIDYEFNGNHSIDPATLVQVFREMGI